MQQVIVRDHLLDAVAQMGGVLRQCLTDAFGGHPNVGDIRGRGLFMGLELVADRPSRQPFDPALRLNARVKGEAMKRGLLCYPMGGTVDGRRGDHVLLAPPFILEERQLDELVEKLGRALDSVLQARGGASRPAAAG